MPQYLKMYYAPVGLNPTWSQSIIATNANVVTAPGAILVFVSNHRNSHCVELSERADCLHVEPFGPTSITTESRASTTPRPIRLPLPGHPRRF